MKYFLIFIFSIILFFSSFAQDLNNYSFEPDLFNTSTAARMNYYSSGLVASNPLGYLNPTLNFWTSGHLQQNYGYTFKLGLDNYYDTGLKITSSYAHLGGYYNFILKNNKNISFGLASKYDKTTINAPNNTQTYFNLELIPSITYFNKTITLSASLTNLSLLHDTSSFYSESKPTGVLLYGEAIFSNVIKTYALEPSVIIGISQYPIFGTGFNLLVSKSILLGLGQITTIYSGSGIYGYFNLWLQVGLKIKDKFYIYLKANQYIYGISATYPILSFAFKYHIYKKNSNVLPRYF